MIAKFTTGLAFLAVLVLAPSPGAAQNGSPPNKTTRTVTGCIHTGDAESTYTLASKDGVWNLSDTSRKLKIGRQINHTVTVRGTVTESFDQKTTDKKSNRLGILEVRKITMVSNSCPD